MHLPNLIYNRSLVLTVFYIVLFYLFITPFSLAINGQGVSANYLFVFFPIVSLLINREISWPPRSALFFMAILGLIFLVGSINQIDQYDLILRRSASFVIFISIFAFMFVSIDSDMIRAFKLTIVLFTLYESSLVLFKFISVDGNNIGYYAKGLLGSQRIGFIYIIAFWLIALFKTQNKAFKVAKFFALYLVLIGTLLTYSRSCVVGLFGSLSLYFIYIFIYTYKDTRSITTSLLKLSSKVLYLTLLLSLFILFFKGPVNFYFAKIYTYAFTSVSATPKISKDTIIYHAKIDELVAKNVSLSLIRKTSEGNVASEEGPIKKINEINQITPIKKINEINQRKASSDAETIKKILEINELVEQHKVSSSLVMKSYIDAEINSFIFTNSSQRKLLSIIINQISESNEANITQQDINKAAKELVRVHAIEDQVQKYVSRCFQALSKANQTNDQIKIKNATQAYEASIEMEKITFKDFDDQQKILVKAFNRRNFILFKNMALGLQKSIKNEKKRKNSTIESKIKIEQRIHDFETLFSLVLEKSVLLEEVIKAVNLSEHNNSKTSLGYRVYMHKLVFEKTLERPLTGSSFLGVWSLFDNKEGSAHSQYIDILFRVGFFAFIIYLTYVFKVLHFLFKKESGLFFGFVGFSLVGLLHETIKLSQGAFVFAFLFAMWAQRNHLLKYYEKSP
jgi:hypothetical protein